MAYDETRRSSALLAGLFATLQTSDVRRQALKGLVDSLSKHQIEDLLAQIDRVEPRQDVVGNLPLELVQMVFGHLPLYQVFAARRVHPKWATILSPTTTELFLRSWFPSAETSLRVPDGLSPSEVTSLKAEHIDAYRNGTPFSRLVQKRPSFPRFSRTCVAYANGILAWVTDNTKRCRLYYIESGEEQTWIAEEAGLVTHIAVSACMVATVMDSGRLCVWTLPHTGKGPQTFQLVSNRVQELVVSGYTLAVLYQASPEEIEADVSTWTMLGNAISHFRVPSHQPHRAAVDELVGSLGPLRKIMVDESSESVILFERFEGKSVLMMFNRFSLSGLAQAKGDLTISSLEHYRRMTRMVPVKVEGCAIVWLFVKAQRELISGSSEPMFVLRTVRVAFNLIKDRLEYHEDMVVSTSPEARPYIRSMFCFKETTYFQSSIFFNQALFVVDTKEAVLKLANSGASWQNETDFGRTPAVTFQSLCGDEVFLVNMHNTGFCVWCFDKNITMAKEDQNYRREMRVAREARKLEKFQSPV